MNELDPRIVKVTLDINGRLQTFQDLAIQASGTKYANAIQSEAEVTIFNLDKDTQNYILSQTSPFNLTRTPKTIIIEAGRQSYGTTKIFEGNIVTAHPTEPPDIGVTMQALTGAFLNGLLVSYNQPGAQALSTIAKQISQQLALTLDFQTLDKSIANFSYTGSVWKQIEALEKIGGINAFADNAALILKTMNAPLNGIETTVDLDHGMIGIPRVTEQGVRVKFLLDSQTRLGGALNLKSKVYPSVNGRYVIYKLGFEIANRNTPFYLIAEARRLY